MPLQATSGAASYDAFGGGVPVVPNYIEDVFSCFLYTGNSSTQTITNGIDLSGKGGMMWLARRDSAFDPRIWDTVRGRAHSVATDLTAAQTTESAGFGLTSFNTDGFSVGPASSTAPNLNNASYVSWTFRKQPKFFDVVTYSGNSVSGRQIAHSLGSAPGFIIVKTTNAADQWCIYHRSQGATKYGLFTTAAFDTYSGTWNNTEPTSTVFTLGNDSFVNSTGRNYVAYLFAHDAGGFGLTGTDNVISCGGFTKSGSSDVTVNLGFEPQWILMKSSSNDQNWFIFDTMRGMSWSAGAVYLNPNSSASETIGGPTFLISATGFTMQGMIADASYIYIAIRRGPMKVPTLGTSVFSPVTYTGTGANNTITGFGFPPDLVVPTSTDAYSGYGSAFADKLRGPNQTLKSSSTSSEDNITNGLLSFNQNGISVGPDNAVGYINWNTKPYVFWNFRRAPSFFDEVCYTGNGSTQTITHNLGVAPELMIVKMRSATSATGWIVYASPLASAATSFLVLNLTDAVGTGNTVLWNSTAPTSSVFSLGASSNINTNGATNVAYLFATCAGVSKVGSYTGNGAINRVIDCGFTSGARFIMLKKTSTTSDWYVYDTARGIVSGGEASLSLNTTAAESGVADVIDPDASGFSVGTSASDFFNESGVTYIFLAIA